MAPYMHPKMQLKDCVNNKQAREEMHTQSEC